MKSKYKKYEIHIVLFLIIFALIPSSDLFSQSGTKCTRHSFRGIEHCPTSNFPYGVYFFSKDSAIFMGDGVVETEYGLGNPSKRECYGTSLRTKKNSKEVWTPVDVSFADKKLGYMLATQYSLDPDENAPKTGRPGIFRTRDTGKTWDLIESISPPNVRLSDIKAVDSTEIYGLLNGDMVLSKDQGLTWTTFGKPTEVGVTAGIFWFMDPKSMKNIFVSGKGGIAKSSDGGLTWERKFEKSAGRLIFLNPKVGYALRGSKDFAYKTEDGGETWFETNFGFPKYQSHGFTYIFPGDDSTAYGLGEMMYQGCIISEGNVGHKCFLGKTSDGGKTWKMLSHCGKHGTSGEDEYHPNDPFLILFGWASPGKDSTVYLVGRGTLYVSNHGGEPVSIEKKETIPTPKLRIYPNPATNLFTVESTEGIKTVSMYDIMGKRVLFKESKLENAMKLDVQHLPHGIYLLQVETQGSSATQRVVME